ncbi:MAG TPA: MmgE/PrpD family protein [Acidimicrobiales bacterium]
MDQTLESLVTFAVETKTSTIPSRALELTKRHLIDTVACGAGGLQSPMAAKLMRVTTGVDVAGGASVYGRPTLTTPELAGFVNGSLNRCLDFNDFGPSGHPSDMVAAQLALAESAGATGADLLRGIYVAYEVATALADAAPIRELPWDGGLYFSVGTAAGAAAVLGLERAAAANAISMALVPNIPLRATREDPSSEWRSSATAYACMAGAFAARLAREGVTAPSAPFEGPRGLFDTAIDPVAVDVGSMAGQSAIERGSLKLFPGCFQIQSGVHAALSLRAHLDPDEIDRVVVRTTPDTWLYVGGGRGDQRERWAPTSRESADHSLPYALANVLLDGGIDQSVYSESTLRGRRWAPLIARVSVVADPELGRGAAGLINATHVRIELTDGRVLSETSTFPYDEAGLCVATDADVRTKFDALTDGVLDAHASDALYRVLSIVDEVEHLDELTRLLRWFDVRTSGSAA